MSKHKISIIGRGTAGAVNAIQMVHYFPNSEVEWFYDPSTPPQAIGEGSTVGLPKMLQYIEMNYPDFEKISANIKTGIKKVNFGGSGDFHHDFPLSEIGMHFDAIKLQDYIREKLSSKLKLIPKKIITHDEIDSNYIIDCSGTPKTFENHHLMDSIPVNTGYVTHCYWDKPEFQYTLTIARPYGWVFGIPLQNRCSIGYMFNSEVSTLEEVQEDVKEIFKQYNLTPSQDTRVISFKNYYKKENFTSRVAYNGNASFFLEPFEANATHNVQSIGAMVRKIINGNMSPQQANLEYETQIKEVEREITIHYYAGSKFNTPFWKQAKMKSLKPMEELLNDPKFINVINGTKTPNGFIQEYAQWGTFGWHFNLKELGILNEIGVKLRNK